MVTVFMPPETLGAMPTGVQTVVAGVSSAEACSSAKPVETAGHEMTAVLPVRVMVCFGATISVASELVASAPGERAMQRKIAPLSDGVGSRE